MIRDVLPPGYELVRELGTDAAGTVLLARQVALGREVAIKRIVGGASSQDPDTVRRFERQARLITALDHPRIVRVHEVVRLGSDLYVVTDRVPGGNLRSLLTAGPLEPDAAARILRDIAAALDYAHEHGVLHGGLEPANVLVREDGAVQVGDFGLAPLLERQALFRAGRAEAMEALAYMAPELARGDLDVDRRADVYSLGAIAYEMLVGRPPFPVDPADPYAAVRAQMEERPPRPGSLVPGFQPLLEAALLWALEKAPERRPATAGELAAALRDGLAFSPTVGAYTEDGRRARRAQAQGGDAPTGGVPDAAARRPRWRAVLALTAVAALFATTAVVAVTRLTQAPSVAAAPLAVTAITAAAQPADGTGHCPGATVTVRATVSTNGSAGTITYEWLRPDGTLTPTGRVRVEPGVRSATITLAVDYSGIAPAQGVAALHVLSPAGVYSQPLRIAYSCP